MESMGVASGCGCKEVYPHIPYSALSSAASLLFTSTIYLLKIRHL